MTSTKWMIVPRGADLFLTTVSRILSLIAATWARIDVLCRPGGNGTMIFRSRHQSHSDTAAIASPAVSPTMVPMTTNGVTRI